MESEIDIDKQEIITPLVSIVVITYNSAKYVLETLDSIKVQTHEKFELIISDDCSTDETLSICNKWIKNNNNFNFNIELITNGINTGISGNINRGLKKTKGKWIKIIAGDDLLLPDCIKLNIDYVKSLNANLIFSQPVYINEFSEIIEETNNSISAPRDDCFYLMNAQKQYLHLLTKDKPMNPPTLFFKKEIVDNLGGFDENFKIEDFPFYLNITKLGYKIFYFPERTVKYRIYNSSFSQKFKNNLGGISGLEIYKVEKIISAHITLDLFLKHPLVALDFINRILYIKLVVYFGNSRKSRDSFSFIRYLSPLRIYNKLMN